MITQSLICLFSDFQMKSARVCHPVATRHFHLRGGADGIGPTQAKLVSPIPGAGDSRAYPLSLVFAARIERIPVTL